MDNKEQVEEILNIFNFHNKREVEKYCKDLVITSEGLTSLILAGQVQAMSPYSYQCHFFEGTPDHLNPTKEELNALGSNGVGKIKGQAKKAVTKMSQVFVERKLLAAHLFFTQTHKYWHLFYFNQRDIKLNRNHWKNGPHIHYASDTITKTPLNEIWNSVCSSKPSFPKSIHIRYDYHHNRKKNAYQEHQPDKKYTRSKKQKDFPI